MSAGEGAAPSVRSGVCGPVRAWSPCLLGQNRQFDGFQPRINKFQAKTVIFDGFGPAHRYSKLGEEGSLTRAVGHSRESGRQLCHLGDFGRFLAAVGAECREINAVSCPARRITSRNAGTSVNGSPAGVHCERRGADGPAPVPPRRPFPTHVSCTSFLLKPSAREFPRARRTHIHPSTLCSSLKFITHSHPESSLRIHQRISVREF